MADAKYHLLDDLFDGVVMIASDHVTWANRAARNMLGLDISDDQGNRSLRSLSPEVSTVLENSGNVTPCSLWCQQLDPTTQIRSRVLRPFDARWVRTEESENDGVLIVRDATNRLAMETLRRSALKDEVSGLLSRTGFLELAGPVVKRLSHNASNSALLVLSVKSLSAQQNNQAIHDGILHDIAIRIRYGSRGSDLAAYLGDNVFGILLNNLVQPKQAHQVAKRIAASVSSPFESFGSIISLPVWVGITIGGEDGRSIDDLLATTLNFANRNGCCKSPYEVVFTDNHLQKLVEREEVRAAELRQGRLLGNVLFVSEQFTSAVGKASLVIPTLPGFTELDIWTEYESNGCAQDLLRDAIAAASIIDSELVVVSYPGKHKKLAKNIMLTYPTLTGRVFSRYLFEAEIDAGECRAEIWNGTSVSLMDLRQAGVSLLLVTSNENDELLQHETKIARTFFNVYELMP